MLSFKQFIIFSEEDLFEASKNNRVAASANVSNDDKGKLHELLLAKHLHPNGRLPEHFRSENEKYGGTAEHVHKKLKEKLEKEHPGAYEEINEHARQTAEAVRKHLAASGHLTDEHEIHSVHWTSNPTDAEKLTGIKEPNSNADLVITTKHKKTGEKKYVGVSAKYGGLKNPNLKNPGLKDLEKQAGHSAGTYTKILEAHRNKMEKLGYNSTTAKNHALWKKHNEILEKEKEEHAAKGGKKEDFIPKSKEAHMAHEAIKSSLEARKEISRLHKEGLSKKSDSELRDLVRSQVSPKAKFHHVVAHSRVNDDGSATSVIKDADTYADTHLSKFKDLKVRHSSGVDYNIVGTYHNPGHPDHGKEKIIMKGGIKNNSGPQKGINGTVTLSNTELPSSKESDKEEHSKKESKPKPKKSEEKKPESKKPEPKKPESKPGSKPESKDEMVKTIINRQRIRKPILGKNTKERKGLR
jgi:hypothetical protein